MTNAAPENMCFHARSLPGIQAPFARYEKLPFTLGGVSFAEADNRVNCSYWWKSGPLGPRQIADEPHHFGGVFICCPSVEVYALLSDDGQQLCHSDNQKPQ